jgi:hypothetical protein
MLSLIFLQYVLVNRAPHFVLKFHEFIYLAFYRKSESPMKLCYDREVGWHKVVQILTPQKTLPRATGM